MSSRSVSFATSTLLTAIVGSPLALQPLDSFAFVLRGPLCRLAVDHPAVGHRLVDHRAVVQQDVVPALIVLLRNVGRLAPDAPLPTGPNRLGHDLRIEPREEPL